MDTLTHIALGACIGEALATKQVGRRALAMGALAQSISDIDFTCAFWLEPSSNVLAHRGFTHSFLFMALVAPLLAAAVHKWGRSPVSFLFWLRFFAIQVAVHIVLDAFNAYGTGWFEPFSHERISFHMLFVADPFFSVPLGIACLVLLIQPVSSSGRMYWALGSMLLSTAYLGYGVTNKLRIDAQVRTALAEQNMPDSHYFTTPTPFNNWLWYVVVSYDSGSYIGYRSVFDERDGIDLHYFPRQDSLLSLAIHPHEVDHLKRFSQGHYTVAWEGDTLVFNDLRFGQMIGWQDPRAGFVFHYYLYPDLDNHLVLQRGRFANWDRSATRALIRRIRGNRISDPKFKENLNELEELKKMSVELMND